MAVTNDKLHKEVAAMYKKHSGADEDYNNLHLHKNAHTGASIHHVGSVKQHSLGYKVKPDAPNAFTGRQSYDPKRNYRRHPIIAATKKLIDKHGGTHTSDGGSIKTSDGYTHHFFQNHGSAYSQHEHQVSKPRINEEAPTNAAGGGNIAGLGIGPSGEPPAKTRLKAMWRRYLEGKAK